MYKLFLLLLLLLNFSCKADFIKLDVGNFAGHNISKIHPSGIEGDFVQYKINIGYRSNLFDSIYLDTFIGPTVIETTNPENNILVGVNLSPRILYQSESYLHPYLMIELGVLYFIESPQYQATDWGFLLGFGPGIKIDLEKNIGLIIEYKILHESNGSKIFGTKEPNPGINSDMINIGLEYKF